jgi:ATP-dependent Clp protease ATP-binding subunit ClpC
MEFISWHYSYAVSFYLARLASTLSAVNHQFALLVLLKTLFSPWKRLIIARKRKGFNPSASFQEMSFNIVSRVIGAVARIILFITGVLAHVVVFVSGAVGFVFWVFIPFVSLPLYHIYMRQPEFVIRELLKGKQGKMNRHTFFQSDPGKFLLTHVAEMSEAFPEEITVPEEKVTTFLDLINFIIQNNTIDQNVLRHYGVTTDDLISGALWWDERRGNKTVLTAERPLGAGIGRSLISGYTPTLDQYSTEMADTAFSHHLIGRESDVSQMTRALIVGNGIIITGVPGVGKKTVVYELARRAHDGLLGSAMSYKRILDFDYNSAISQTHDVTQKKEILSTIFSEAEQAGNVILMIRDIQRLTNAELEGLDITDVLTTHLENRKLLLVVVVDREDYDHYLSRNERLKKFFEVLTINEMSKDEAFPILMAHARVEEKRSGNITSVPVLRKIMQGSDEYLSSTPFPEKALELFDSVLTFHAEKGTTKTVTAEEVQMVLSEKTGIALSTMGEGEKVKLADLEDLMHKQLVGQEYPISLIAKAIRAKTSGVINNARPIGSFLFLGPTGVGKTETAKVLAHVYFGESRVMRFDMAEYNGSEGLERLIGNASTNTPGTLTTALQRQPSGLLLLDEIEKASPAIFNLFLSLLDEGKITDAFGKSVSARHTFVVATSNAGSEYIRSLVGQSVEGEQLQKQVLDHVLTEHLFSPEFLNRFDGVVVYEPLTEEELTGVARLMLSGVQAQMKEKGIALTFVDAVYTKVAHDGYDPALGARPMRRTIELTIGDMLAQALLRSEIKPGDEVLLTVDSSTANFVLQPK